MRYMPIEHISDWEKRLDRADAFWSREIIDRPVVCFSLRKPEPVLPPPSPPDNASIRDLWLDAEWVARKTLAYMMNQDYYGDALPHAHPNLGPELFSAFFGCEMEYGPRTSWSIPCLKDWSQAPEIRFSEDNFYWKKLVEITDALLEVGRNRFYVGITDLHPGGDAIAALRDPEQLNFDLIEHPDEVKALLERINSIYFKVYDYWFERLSAAGQPCTTWFGIVSRRKWYVPSNDFSCMISRQMFDEFFLPGIIEECRHMEANIYHLDGPGALHHLDSLLDIKELNAIQWGPGAGNGRASDWMWVYKKCQAARKGLFIPLEPDEIDYFMENLRPEGLWIVLRGVQNPEHGQALLRKLSEWK